MTKTTAVVEVLVIATSLCFFSAFMSARSSHLYAMVALCIAAITIGRGIPRLGAAGEAFGFTRNALHLPIASVVGVVIGLLAGLSFRNMQSASLVPPTLTAFAIIAAAIGASEELVYRGFVWSRLEAFGALGAVGGSVVAHTAYKCALFAGLLISHQINPVTFIFWTICGSLICAILRLASRHVLPSIIAHLVFDVIVYGDCLHAPWWVWG